ncbi:MAG: cardiolipin synthase [Rhodospirillales bacterium]|nr:cardiolipin synthase [Rhodospirillales bacterium]
MLDLLSDARVHVTLVGGFILAVCATVHILLTKREVASAVGWIGLVWLASFLGLAIYLVFGVNRVRRRARQVRGTAGDLEAGNRGHSLEVPDGLAALGRGVGRITGAPLVRASDVVVLHNGDEAYAPMLAAIEAARHSVGLSSYIFRNDVWGGQFIEALIAAHRRGVAVRVLIDGIGGGWLLSPTYHRLRRAGVPAARFMHSPLPWRMPFINLRCHKKILVVDGTHGFTGGLNIGDENVAATRPAHPVQDMHFRIEGQVVGQLARAFAADWQFATGEELTGEAWFPRIQEEDGVLARVIDSGPDEDIEKVEFAVLQAVACARQTVQIMTPYFLPDERLVTALALAAMRGVAVEVILPERGNHILVDWASRANVGPLLDAGVRLSQSPPPFHHAKLMVVDGVWCLIGSCNWDIRSFRLNFELCVEIYDEGLARVLGAVMTGARGAALTAEDIARLPLPIRLRDAAARLMLPYL